MTGSNSGDQTDDPIYMQLFGTYDESAAATRLNTSDHNDFEEGAKYFTSKPLKLIQELTTIRLEKYGNNVWCYDWVAVSCEVCGWSCNATRGPLPCLGNPTTLVCNTTQKEATTLWNKVNLDEVKEVKLSSTYVAAGTVYAANRSVDDDVNTCALTRDDDQTPTFSILLKNDHKIRKVKIIHGSDGGGAKVYLEGPGGIRSDCDPYELDLEHQGLRKENCPQIAANKILVQAEKNHYLSICSVWIEAGNEKENIGEIKLLF